MSYQVHITSTAEHDIMCAADYIEFTLKNSDSLRIVYGCWNRLQNRLVKEYTK